MRFFRTLIFAAILVAAFFCFTTYRSGRLHSADWLSHPQRVEITEAAGSESFDAEEQNNICLLYTSADQDGGVRMGHGLLHQPHAAGRGGKVSARGERGRDDAERGGRAIGSPSVARVRAYSSSLVGPLGFEPRTNRL